LAKQRLINVNRPLWLVWFRKRNRVPFAAKAKGSKRNFESVVFVGCMIKINEHRASGTLVATTNTWHIYERPRLTANDYNLDLISWVWLGLAALMTFRIVTGLRTDLTDRLALEAQEHNTWWWTKPVISSAQKNLFLGDEIISEIAGNELFIVYCCYIMNVFGKYMKRHIKQQLLMRTFSLEKAAKAKENFVVDEI